MTVLSDNTDRVPSRRDKITAKNAKNRQERRDGAESYHKDTKTQRSQHSVIPSESDESRNLSGQAAP